MTFLELVADLCQLAVSISKVINPNRVGFLSHAVLIQLIKSKILYFSYIIHVSFSLWVSIFDWLF
jgi:hypothetical protein